MKILHINSYYSMSLFYKNLYDYQKKNGIDMDVFVSVPLDFKAKNFDYGEYTLIRRNHNKYDRILFHYKHNKIYKDIKKQYDINSYSMIHAHSLFSNGYIAMRLKKEFGVPYIVAVRNTDVNIFFKRMIHLRKLGINILEEAENIVFLSKSYRDKVIANFVPVYLKESVLRKSMIISNGIDSFWFDNLGVAKNTIDFSNLRLLQVGDIDWNKNITTTVKVVSLLIENGVNATLDVVGKIKNKKIFDEITVLNFVNYLGVKSQTELLLIYRTNDIFILPSINETFGLVYAEAMSQGLPVIYSKNEGFDKQFSDGLIGYSVEAENERDIAEKIQEICSNYNTMSKTCITNSYKFEWSLIADIYLNIYV